MSMVNSHTMKILFPVLELWIMNRLKDWLLPRAIIYHQRAWIRYKEEVNLATTRSSSMSNSKAIRIWDNGSFLSSSLNVDSQRRWLHRETLGHMLEIRIRYWCKTIVMWIPWHTRNLPTERMRRSTCIIPEPATRAAVHQHGTRSCCSLHAETEIRSHRLLCEKIGASANHEQAKDRATPRSLEHKIRWELVAKKVLQSEGLRFSQMMGVRTWTSCKLPKQTWSRCPLNL